MQTVDVEWYLFWHCNLKAKTTKKHVGHSLDFFSIVYVKHKDCIRTPSVSYSTPNCWHNSLDSWHLLWHLNELIKIVLFILWNMGQTCSNLCLLFRLVLWSSSDLTTFSYLLLLFQFIILPFCLLINIALKWLLFLCHIWYSHDAKHLTHLHFQQQFQVKNPLIKLCL